jgi:methionyl-tRNA formyltransferase
MNERIAWIGADQPRHLYYINEIRKHFPILGGIMQTRGDKMPEMPGQLTYTDQKNWNKHFNDRLAAEKKYFGEQEIPDFPLLRVDKDTLNSLNSAQFIKDIKPDLVLVFGPGMIRDPLLAALPKDTVNLHLGLSPRYRGAATLFWPFYFLEPNWAGATFHHIVATPDGGDIIHQTRPKMNENDGIHDFSARVVLEATKEALRLIKMYPNWQEFSQKPESGKNFLESDFRPQHLRIIYNVYHNDMIKKFLNGQLQAKEPKLKRQFK